MNAHSDHSAQSCVTSLSFTLAWTSCLDIFDFVLASLFFFILGPDKLLGCLVFTQILLFERERERERERDLPKDIAPHHHDHFEERRQEENENKG
jgi:hypothetical protein